MSYDSWPNLVTMFFEKTAELGDKPFLWAKRDENWASITGNEAAARVAALSRGLRELGVGDGDRVMLVSENRPEWAIADFAIMAAGAVSVPAYVTNQIGDHLHVASNSGAKAAIVSTAQLAERFLPAAKQSLDMRVVIAIEEPKYGPDQSLEIHLWDDVLERHAGAPNDVAERACAIERTDTSCLIYTSGTGGVPKGVMLSHGAIIANCKGAHQLLDELGLEDEVFLSFLPLSHSYEHTAGLMFPISIAAQIYYAEGVDRLAGNMLEASPTLMTAVPRLYETMHGRIIRGVRQAGGLQEKLFNKAVELGTRKYEGGEFGPITSIVDAVLERLVRAKVRARFGGRLKALVSGGAPLNYDIGVFFTSLGLRILQGYGQTESAPVISCNPPSKVKIDTVGPSVVDVDVKIAEDGEILVRGELVMQGYWKDDGATAQAIRDGWLHTGDIGELDADDYIRITDRKKDIIVNSGGDNISPQRVEGFLTVQPEIAQAMVHGDNRPHLVALVVPEEEFVRDWANSHNRPTELGELANDPNFRQAISEVIDRVNASLAVIERVRRFTIATEPFTIENALLTPSFKIRRHKITDIHLNTLEALYGH